MIPKQVFLCNGVIDEKSVTSSMRWKALNPEYSIYLYDNEMCHNFLVRELGGVYGDIFDFIRDGPIKADFWRLCVLYRRGGVYSDIDNVPITSLAEVIDAEAELVVPTSYWLRMGFKFNPNFIMCHRHDSVIEKCVKWYVDKFNNRRNHVYGYWGWSIMRCFTEVLVFPSYRRVSGVYDACGKKIQLLLECEEKKHTDAHTDYMDVVFFHNRSDDWDHINHRFI